MMSDGTSVTLNKLMILHFCADKGRIQIQSFENNELRRLSGPMKET